MERAHQQPEGLEESDPVTGLFYVRARPGERMVTSEEIRKELEDFP